MTTTERRDPALDHVDLPITGMTCASCAARIERGLNRLDGVDATVNYVTEKASVDFDPATASQSDLVTAVERLGYRVVDRARGAGRATTAPAAGLPEPDPDPDPDEAAPGPPASRACRSADPAAVPPGPRRRRPTQEPPQPLRPPAPPARGNTFQSGGLEAIRGSVTPRPRHPPGPSRCVAARRGPGGRRSADGGRRASGSGRRLARDGRPARTIDRCAAARRAGPGHVDDPRAEVRRLAVAELRPGDAGRHRLRLAVPPSGVRQPAPRRHHDGHARLDGRARRLRVVGLRPVLGRRR